MMDAPSHEFLARSRCISPISRAPVTAMVRATGMINRVEMSSPRRCRACAWAGSLADMTPRKGKTKAGPKPMIAARTCRLRSRAVTGATLHQRLFSKSRAWNEFWRKEPSGQPLEPVDALLDVGVAPPLPPGDRKVEHLPVGQGLDEGGAVSRGGGEGGGGVLAPAPVGGPRRPQQG